MAAVFLKLVDMSLSASILVLIVLALRLVLKKAPKAMRCALWALVAIRLLCPFSLESTLSLMPETNPLPEKVLSSPVSEIENGSSAEVPTSGAGSSGQASFVYRTIPAEDGTQEILAPAADTETVVNWLEIGGTLWLMGMAAMLFYALWSYRRIHQKVQASIDIGNGVYICDYIDSPFILGIVKPRIYLSSATHPEDAAHVLAHERAHLKRRDHWWKPLGFLLLSVYWFNPLIWAAYILLCRDIELACDERVVKDMDIPEKKAYSEALLNCSVPRRMIAACPLAFGEVGVRERVKSVLRYKKPAFWLVLLAVIAVVMVAVCFLTDPAANTLANFQKISKDEIVSIDIQEKARRVSLDTDAELSAFWNILENTEYDPRPVSEERREEIYDEYNWRYPSVKIHYAETTVTYYFTYDYTEFWFNDGVKPSNPYPVKNPEGIADFIQTYTDVIYNLTVTAAPFASIEEPWQWMQNIQTDALRQVGVQRAESGSSITGSYMSAISFEELLEILRRIPQDALIPAETVESSDLMTVLTSDPNTAIRIADAANNIGVVLRYYGETVEIVMCEDMDTIVETAVKPKRVTKWEIQSAELLAYMKAFYEHPPTVSVGSFVSKYDTEHIPLTVSHGDASILAVKLTDWDYEAVEYSETTGSFGIRCRPKAVDEGWLYYSFWPDGYDAPEEEDRCYSQQKYSVGDYVILSENADSWLTKYQVVLDDMWGFIFFQYGTAASADAVRTYGDVTVDFSNVYTLYEYDWESIAGEIGAKKLVLFDPQEFDDLLFVGCQVDANHTFLVFQKNEKGAYDFVEILPITAVRRETYDAQTVLIYADYETDDTSVRLYLLTNEDITAYSYRTTYEDYVLLDRCPAVIVLDTSEKDFPGCFFHVDYDEPIGFSHLLNNNSSILFRSIEDAANSLFDVDYITGSLVWFYDGTSYAGHSTLTRDELLQFRDILLSLSSEEIEPGSVEKDFRIQVFLTCKDGVSGDGEIWNMDFAYENDSVNMTLIQRSHYSDIKGIESSFTIRNAQLNAFMERLCDRFQAERAS